MEGQAASDEEEDEKWQEAQRPPAEVKTLLAHLSSCASGYVIWDRPTGGWEFSHAVSGVQSPFIQ